MEEEKAILLKVRSVFAGAGSAQSSTVRIVRLSVCMENYLELTLGKQFLKKRRQIRSFHRPNFGLKEP